MFKRAYRWDPSQQSEGIADVGQHKYGQRQTEINIISTAAGKAPSPPTELVPTSDYWL
jgi:hypothetical protein